MSALLLIAALGLIALSLTPRLPAKPWRFIDLPSHFVVQYSAGAIVLFTLSLVFSAPAPALLAVAAFAINFVELRPLLPGTTPKAHEGPALKILQVNVLKTHQNTDRLKRMILEQKPDLVTCAEVNPEFTAMVKALADEYPHQLITAGKDSYRVAVASKLPFLKIEQTAFGDARTDAVVFRVALGGKNIDGVSIHPFTPTANIKSRDGEFAAVAARFAAEKPAYLMLMGDFNATPWCPAMKQLLKTLGLRNAREGRGINTTWPAFFPFLFRIPIDHVLVSANLGVAAFGAGPGIGSDHLPTLTTVYIK